MTNKYLILNVSRLYRQPFIKSCEEYESLIRKCVKYLYSLNNNIFDILFKKYCDKKDGSEYINFYKRNLMNYQRGMKLQEKYSSLLRIKSFVF